MNDDLIALLKSHAADLSQLKRSIGLVQSGQVGQGKIKNAAHKVASRWFNEVKSALEGASATTDLLAPFSAHFERLMQISRIRAAKSTYVQLLDDIAPKYQELLIHAAEIGAFSTTPAASIAPYISGLPAEEGTYLDEAQRCLGVNALRGCIVLGWCATIARIHEKIGKIGYDQFSKATEEMAAKDYGRFKPFNKKLRVESLSELQRLFDTDLLWVLEYLQLIDGNQHQRLRYCFDLRNHSAHPGAAPIEPENVYAFYSDITKIILKNPKFS